MSEQGWKELVAGWPWFRGEGQFPVYPNSEYMPPIRTGLKPYGTWDAGPRPTDDDPWGWPITEYEERLQLVPGFHDIARQLLDRLVPLCTGKSDHGIASYKLEDNPYWPPELAKRAKALSHEQYVLLMPLSMSQTQDCFANFLWTLYGNSEQGPSLPFWKSFYTAPRHELPAEEGRGFFANLLTRVYGVPAKAGRDLRAAGFRILPVKPGTTQATAGEPFPSWARELLIGDADPLKGVEYLLTFRPFRDLPAAVKKKYFAGKLHLLPCPASLIVWGIPAFEKLAKHLRYATQIPLMQFLERHDFGRLRIPQSGWFEECHPDRHSERRTDHLPIRGHYHRSYRQARVNRFEDRLVTSREHKICHTLFSTRPQDIDLYYKPMARNSQLWTEDHEPLLDGPRATPDDLLRAAERVAEGGLFGYRFIFPPMCVGQYELYWHRTLAAYHDAEKKKAVTVDGPPGWITGYRLGDPDYKFDVELWPRILDRPAHAENVALFHALKAEDPPQRTMTNVLKVLDAWERGGQQALTPEFAEHLLIRDKGQTPESWLRSLSKQVGPSRKARAEKLAATLRSCVAPGPAVAKKAKAVTPTTLTFDRTANRGFEETYWKTIAHLSSHAFCNKNNADCVLDEATKRKLRHHGRDLEAVGEYLLDYYESLVKQSDGPAGVQIGELPFSWKTHYPFPWMGGWLRNQEEKCHERNLLVKIPGRDRTRAVIMADHYDTAYMYDHYEAVNGGNGARLSSAGSDDNCSATAALMLGAPAFIDLSKHGRLACDVWLVHLTGEEYPAEGLGNAKMCQWLVEDSLVLTTRDGRKHPQTGVRVEGVYVLDMIAHDTKNGPGVFQISPGHAPESLDLARHVHLANLDWNASCAVWNKQPARKTSKRARRSTTRDGSEIPPLAPFKPLNGELRTHLDPRSTLFNTDGQAYSDIGVPVVLLMENYDIGRVGYHDTHDNMTLIDLDYGAALAAISIESVARAAGGK
jgi:hypothetical protein